jgi:hypothetical protein
LLWRVVAAVGIQLQVGAVLEVYWQQPHLFLLELRTQ